MSNGIARLLSKDDGKTVGQVELLDGTILDCDIAVMGIGATYYTDWLKESEIDMRPDGSIVTDKVLVIL